MISGRHDSDPHTSERFVATHEISTRRKSSDQAACGILPRGAGRAVFRRKPRSAKDIVAGQQSTHVLCSQYVTAFHANDDRTLLDADTWRAQPLPRL